MTPTTLEALQATVVAWCGAVTGRETIVEDEGGPPPAAPYLSLSIRSCTPLQRDRIEVDRQDETISTLHRVVFRLALSGGQAMSDAARLRASLWSARRWRDLWTMAGLGAVTAIHNLSALETGRIRARAEFQLTLHAVIASASSPEYFTTQRIDLYETDQGRVATVDTCGDC